MHRDLARWYASHLDGHHTKRIIRLALCPAGPDDEGGGSRQTSPSGATANGSLLAFLLTAKGCGPERPPTTTTASANHQQSTIMMIVIATPLSSCSSLEPARMRTGDVGTFGTRSSHLC